MTKQWILASVLLWPVSVLAGDASGFSFSHKDWELSCDNTGTCRAAGYQTEANIDHPVSILLIRKAGPNTPVLAQVQITETPHEAVQQPKAKVTLNMQLNRQSLGKIELNREGIGRLSAQQTQELLKALTGSNQISFSREQQHWQLSDQGATAVLLKMDAAQQRVGTASALVRPGRAAQGQVLQAQPIPVISKHYQPGPAQHFSLSSAQAKKLMVQFKPTTNQEDCPLLFDGNFLEHDQLSIYPLGKQKVVVESPCWRGAYNAGSGYWVMDTPLKQISQLVTTMGSSFSEGEIFAHHKGRGLGDCWGLQEWAWDGQKFIQSYVATTGQCKGFTGGAWQLPTLIKQVN